MFKDEILKIQFCSFHIIEKNKVIREINILIIYSLLIKHCFSRPWAKASICNKNRAPACLNFHFMGRKINKSVNKQINKRMSYSNKYFEEITQGIVAEND